MTETFVQKQKGSFDYIIVAGPTASGKSELALDLATWLDGEIINADSMQLYSNLEILSARPNKIDLEIVRHHLYGIFDANHRTSVAEWLQSLRSTVNEVKAREKLPIIVGGSGMYLNVAVEGLSPIPEISLSIHKDCIKQLSEEGGKKFRSRLKKYDPILAERLVDGDSQRLIRAMSVFKSTGKPLSFWQKLPNEGRLSGLALKLLLLPPRETLYQRINRRVDKMLVSGALEEIKLLAEMNLDPTLPLMKALGVRQLMAVVNGTLLLDDAADLIKRDSRRYAKRQMTWLRNNYHAEIFLKKKLSESLAQKIFPFIRHK